MAFHMTGAAAREILAAAQRSGAAGAALRVAAKPSREGMSYGMGFDDPAPGDEVAVFDGLTVLIGAESGAWLAETVLDFVELDAGGHDFIFVQPQPASSGGCASQPRSCGSGRCGSCG
ncbi:MAG: intracellular sulfur oxidation protein DsrR [Ramlibacter sp.]|nr:intracellular sulfur oxidation protein DsrR [Ramlibacter sp.]